MKSQKCQQHLKSTQGRAKDEDKERGERKERKGKGKGKKGEQNGPQSIKERKKIRNTGGNDYEIVSGGKWKQNEIRQFVKHYYLSKFSN